MNTTELKTAMNRLAVAAIAFIAFSCAEENAISEPQSDDAVRKGYVAEMKFESGAPTFGCRIAIISA